MIHDNDALEDHPDRDPVRRRPLVLLCKVFDPHTIPLVWQIAAAKPPPVDARLAQRRASDRGRQGAGRRKPIASPLPKNLLDPTHELDHFYARAAARAAQRVLHYGDSPTTADLITADARACCKRSSATAARASC